MALESSVLGPNVNASAQPPLSYTDIVMNFTSDRLFSATRRPPAGRTHTKEPVQESFVRPGYGATAIEPIAALTGVWGRTVYRHFDSKAALAADPMRDAPSTSARRLLRSPLCAGLVRSAISTRFRIGLDETMPTARLDLEQALRDTTTALKTLATA